MLIKIVVFFGKALTKTFFLTFNPSSFFPTPLLVLVNSGSGSVSLSDASLSDPECIETSVCAEVRRVRPLVDIRPDFVGTAGLLVRLDDDVTLEGVVERGVVSGAELRPVIEIPRPRFVAVFTDAV